ncbi:yip1 domain-containing protein [Apiospora sp. TS-2023a]
MKRAALLGAAAAAAATIPTTNAEWFRGGGSNRQKWEPARATATSSEAANALGWTPRPTPGPAEAILRHELLKRAGTSTCGYFVGTTSPSAAIVCSGSSQCIVNDSNKAMGCCSSSNIQACNVATTCIESSDAATISSATAAYTLLCKESGAPSCVTYTYATDSPYSGFRAFACGTKREVLTVAYTAPGAASTGITSAAGATTTTTTAPQNSLPSEGGGNASPITITSSTSSQPSSANPTTSAGSPTTTTSNGAGGGSTSSSAPAPTNDNANNSTPTILAGEKKKEHNLPKRPPIEKIKRPYMPAAFPNSFDYVAAYREARASRRQSGGRRSSGFTFRRSIVNSARFPMPPVPKQPRTVRDIRQEEFDFGTGTRPSPTFSVPVNRNNRGVGPVPASAAKRAGSSFSRHPFTHFDSGSTSTLPRPSSMSVETSPRRRDGAARGGTGAAEEARDSVSPLSNDVGVLDDEPLSAHTDFDSRFTPPFISPPAGLRSPTTDNNIGIATVLAPAPAARNGDDRIASTTGATAGSMRNSRALPSPRSPQYTLFNPKYGRPKEVPVKRPVGHLEKIQ